MKRILLVVIISMAGLLDACNKDNDPEPVASMAGIYEGSLQDRNSIIHNVRANVAIGKIDNNLRITSIGLTANDYQLVLGSTYYGVRNGFAYRLYADVDGTALNISGNITSMADANIIYGRFSFTGIKGR
jgi:hypothetical protein